MLEEKENTSVAEENKNEYAPPLVSAVNPAEENGEALRSDRQPKRAKRKLWWIPVLAVAVLLLGTFALYLVDYLRPANGGDVLIGSARAFLENYREIIEPAVKNTGDAYRIILSSAQPKEIGNRVEDVFNLWEITVEENAMDVHSLMRVGTQTMETIEGYAGDNLWMIGNAGDAEGGYRLRFDLDGAAGALETSILNPAVSTDSPFFEFQYRELYDTVSNVEQFYDKRDSADFDWDSLLAELKRHAEVEKKTQLPTAETLKEGLQGFRPIKTYTYSLNADGLADTLSYAIEQANSSGYLRMLVSYFKTDLPETLSDIVRSSGVSATLTVTVQGNRLRALHIDAKYRKEASAEDDSRVKVQNPPETEYTWSLDAQFRYSGNIMTHFEILANDTGAENPDEPVLQLVYESQKKDEAGKTSIVEYRTEENSGSSALQFGDGAWSLFVGSSAVNGTYSTESEVRKQGFAEWTVTDAVLYQPIYKLSLKTGLACIDRYITVGRPLTVRLEKPEEKLAVPQDLLELPDLTAQDCQRIKKSCPNSPRMSVLASETQASDGFTTEEGYTVITDESNYQVEKQTVLMYMSNTVTIKYGSSQDIYMYVRHRNPDYYWLLNYKSQTNSLYYGLCVELTPELAAIYQPAEQVNDYYVFKK